MTFSAARDFAEPSQHYQPNQPARNLLVGTLHPKFISIDALIGVTKVAIPHRVSYVRAWYCLRGVETRSMTSRRGQDNDRYVNLRRVSERCWARGHDD